MAECTKNQNRREFILKAAKLAGAIGMSLAPMELLAGDKVALIKSAKVSSDKNGDKLIITLDRPAKHKIFTLKSPDRVVVDLSNTKQSNLKLNGTKGRNFTGLRYATRNKNDLRLVLDLKKTAEVKSSVKGNQLEVFFKFSSQTAASDKKTPVKRATKPVKEQRPISPLRSRGGAFVVAIDAGHGGRDPGAVGARGTREKDVVLQIAKKLKAKIDRQPGMRGVLIREGDYYVPLRKRMDIARRKHADLFISIHADANPHRNLKGSSVYILSENGASSEAARWLANKENAYDSNLAGANLSNDSTLNSMLMDLSQAATIDNSLNIAKRTLRELGGVNRLLHSKVESAAFVVLKSPDIPSILVETAFISNPTEEKRLRTSAYQSKMANAMFRGIKSYQLTLAPGGKLHGYASVDNAPNHIVQPGDSISKIAREYGVSLNQLRRENQLSSSTIKVGQHLSIPVSS
ncbi:MAG: N-acetylmuramoyl-L-alanine amidase (EC [uncultured Thiotrichaceae bacterium]|uniref:N-acetylmuramoyl-L-alanine amidase AmiC n=1 Tax=uncultured Thiotrichaceae bacterium TaxID=298394 RepID=A0A6S6T020_9GAMM|nr:MAG: N-acetylmuramoyl-L-alanine amidase (EC [uncultured Thiotrichaceae bacterium]